MVKNEINVYLDFFLSLIIHQLSLDDLICSITAYIALRL